MLLTGTFVRSVDEKRRVAIPKRIREALGWDDNAVLYVAPGTDGSLALYTEEAFKQLAQKLDQASPTSRDVLAFSRLFYAQAQRAELDNQGRVRIPPELAELAALGKEAVLLGVRDHFELWDKQCWQGYQAEKQKKYDEIAERAFDHGE